jgi:site-specific DNA-methyltransferase (adenine-specific)
MKPDKIYTGRSTIRMYNCDCMELLNSGKKWDLAIVDPPYGIDVTKMNMGSRKTVKPDKTKSWDLRVPDDKYFDGLFNITKRQIVWGGNYFKLPQSQYFCIWDKGETMYGRDFAECEYAWVSGGGTRIFKKSPNQLQRIHSTQKPAQLYKWLLINYAKEGDTILDTHGGSMSIAIACWDLGFDLDICELDTDYFNDAVKRFEQHISQTQLF